LVLSADIKIVLSSLFNIEFSCSIIRFLQAFAYINHSQQKW